MFAMEGKDRAGRYQLGAKTQRRFVVSVRRSTGARRYLTAEGMVTETIHKARLWATYSKARDQLRRERRDAPWTVLTVNVETHYRPWFPLDSLSEIGEKGLERSDVEGV